VLVSNGLLLGAVFALMQVYGHAAPLWEFVVGHGVLEISEITMAGGSGLLLGYAMLQPGLLSRQNALMLAAQKSVRLLLGSVPLLVVAGTIEGLLSPSDAPAWIKYAVGIGSGVLLYGYLLLVGRRSSH
ncbi:MAG: stage II sporulation protein M, partial [Chloroflexi bacterium]|nr:stage II sporulation protein M [Chloroflexota bacterium]